ncbi:MAG: hypothetical protein RR293_08190 [Bacteroidales bacterium]
MKGLITILAAFFTLLAINSAVESAKLGIETKTSNEYSLSSPENAPSHNPVISLSVATIPASAILDLRNNMNPDCRTTQRNIKSAIGDIIRFASSFNNTLTIQNEALNDGSSENITKYLCGYYIFATRHILI